MTQHILNNIGFQTGFWPIDQTKRSIVFIHGASITKRLWHFQTEALGQIANTIAIDLPGHGSSKGNGFNTIEMYSKIVAQFVDDLKIPKPILCGLSMGGAIVQQLLLDLPEKFLAGVLVSTGVQLNVLPLIMDMVKNNYTGYIELLKSMPFSGKTGSVERDQVIDEIMDETFNCPSQVALNDFEACRQFDLTHELKYIQTPVLIVAGEKDKLTPPKYGIFLKDNIASAHYIKIKNAGHMVPVEQPEEFNRILKQFLNLLIKVDESVKS